MRNSKSVGCQILYNNSPFGLLRVYPACKSWYKAQSRILGNACVAIATINRLITLFDGAFKALSAEVCLTESERLAMVVQFSMDTKTRAYHTTGHVFGLCEGMSPHQVLAALFHDLVYCQLDGGFPESTVEILQGVTRTQDGALILQPIASDDMALALCAAIFDFQPGQTLPLYDGMNEFLSAVVAARLLQQHLAPQDLLAVVACIEATIPFRATDIDGLSRVDKLALRVYRQYQALGETLGLERDRAAIQAYVDRVVGDAVGLANRDLGSFAHADPAAFLFSTWQLIDESNVPLTRLGVYSLRQYRDVLMRMEGFLGMLNPESVFLRYQDTPSAADAAALCTAATRNIAFACDFLDAKVASVAIVEALALSTGTDCPVSMFLGDISSAYGRPDRVEDFLPQAPLHARVDSDLLGVFETGRTLASNNDLTASPLTAFVYRYQGYEGTRKALRHARDMFAGLLSPKAFLQTLNRDMVCAIIQACSHIALSRTETLRALERSLETS